MKEGTAFNRTEIDAALARQGNARRGWTTAGPA
jgi:hypothetical protein